MWSLACWGRLPFSASTPHLRWLALILLGLGAVVLALRPVLGLLALVLAALVGRAEFGTGTAVAVNPATLLVPALLVVWVLYMVLRRGYPPGSVPHQCPIGVVSSLQDSCRF